MNKIKCPECGSRCTEEHGTSPRDHHWFFCRVCGLCWDEKLNEKQKEVGGDG